MVFLWVFIDKGGGACLSQFLDMIQNACQKLSEGKVFILSFLLAFMLLVSVSIGLNIYLLQEESEVSNLFLGAEDSSVPAAIAVELPSEAVSSESLIYIDIKGAVIEPNMYALPAGSRMYDAIEKAGGLSEEAARDTINLAQLLEDQMLIYIYSLEEVREFEMQANESLSPASTAMFFSESQRDPQIAEPALVNINSADSLSLQSLPNIGPKKAEAIIQYRQENGSFQSIEEITQVSGIGEKTFAQLQDLITLGQP